VDGGGRGLSAGMENQKRAHISACAVQNTGHQVIKKAGTQGFISLWKHPREPWRVVRNLAAPDAAVP